MRYFKYNHPKNTEKEIYKAERAALNKTERRLARKSRFWNIAGIIAYCIVFGTIFIPLFLIFNIEFAPAVNTVINVALEILGNLLTFILRFGALIIAFALAFIITSPIMNISHKADKRLNGIRREHLHEISSKACEHITKFYGLREPSIVTKCYDSTDAKFKNKDIIIFECSGEIRIMRNLFGSVKLIEHDLGCYAFKKGEYYVYYTEYKGKRAALLDFGEVKLTLAARAKPFIEKLARYEEGDIFIPAKAKKKGSSAYYEFSFCKKNMPIDELTKNGYEHWSEDSLLLYIDDDARFFEHYKKYFEKPHSPDGSRRFYYAGVNYYTAEEAEKILEKIEKDAPPYSAPLIAWLKQAQAYNGFFLLGV